MAAPPDDFTCRELVELVTEYLEMALPPRETARFEEHLAACKGCTRYFEQMRHTIRTAGALREDDIEPAARDQLMNIFRNWKRGGGASS